MDGHISYGWGAKAAFKSEPQDIKSLDCSGFVRYFLYRVTSGTVQIPDGSYHQNAWCKSEKMEAVDYATAANADDWLRLAYFPQKGTKDEKDFRAGHVWLVLNGKTLESWGGKGPDRRAWDTKVLKDNVTNCYKLAEVRQDSAAVVMCFDLDRLLDFFRVCAWARVTARQAYPRYVKADFGFLSPISSAGYFEIELGDTALVETQSKQERTALVDSFLQKAAANIPQAIQFIDFLTKEAQGNFSTLQKMLEDARFSQQNFLETVDSLSSWLVRLQTAGEIALSVSSLFVPPAGWIYFGEKVAVQFATSLKEGPQATALAVGGVGVSKLSKAFMEKTVVQGLTKIGAASHVAPAKFALKFLFVAKDLEDKIAVMVNPRLAFDRY